MLSPKEVKLLSPYLHFQYLHVETLFWTLYISGYWLGVLFIHQILISRRARHVLQTV